MRKTPQAPTTSIGYNNKKMSSQTLMQQENHKTMAMA
jgi:hypothetical protein